MNTAPADDSRDGYHWHLGSGLSLTGILKFWGVFGGLETASVRVWQKFRSPPYKNILSNLRSGLHELVALRLVCCRIWDSVHVDQALPVPECWKVRGLLIHIVATSQWNSLFLKSCTDTLYYNGMSMQNKIIHGFSVPSNKGFRCRGQNIAFPAHSVHHSKHLISPWVTVVTLWAYIIWLATKGWRNVEKRPTLVFFFQRSAWHPPTFYLPNRVCFSQTYVFFFKKNSEDLRVTSKLITGGWMTFDVD